jgi:hypothetical protein
MSKKNVIDTRNLKDCLPNLPLKSENPKRNQSLFYRDNFVLPLSITINLDGESITSVSHTHSSHSQTSRLLTSSLSSRVDPTDLVFSLSLHRYAYVGLLVRSRFIDS